MLTVVSEGYSSSLINDTSFHSPAFCLLPLSETLDGRDKWLIVSLLKDIGTLGYRYRTAERPAPRLEPCLFNRQSDASLTLAEETTQVSSMGEHMCSFMRINKYNA